MAAIDVPYGGAGETTLSATPYTVQEYRFRGNGSLVIYAVGSVVFVNCSSLDAADNTAVKGFPVPVGQAFAITQGSGDTVANGFTRVAVWSATGSAVVNYIQRARE